jgi:hypothetical protein
MSTKGKMCILLLFCSTSGRDSCMLLEVDHNLTILICVVGQTRYWVLSPTGRDTVAGGGGVKNMRD